MKTLDEYQTEAMRSAPQEQQLVTFALGIAGESGEIVDLIKKHIGHGHPLDVEKLKRELGDVLWYVAGLAHLHGIALSDVAQTNIEKLEKRYPNGFNTADSIARRDAAPTNTEKRHPNGYTTSEMNARGEEADRAYARDGGPDLPSPYVCGSEAYCMCRRCCADRRIDP